LPGVGDGAVQVTAPQRQRGPVDLEAGGDRPVPLLVDDDQAGWRLGRVAAAVGTERPVDVGQAPLDGVELADLRQRADEGDPEHGPGPHDLVGQ